MQFVCDFSTCVIEQALRDACLWKLSNKIPIKLTSILFIYDVVPNTSISRWFFVKWNVKYLQEGRFMVDDCLTERIGGLRYLKTRCIDWEMVRWLRTLLAILEDPVHFPEHMSAACNYKSWHPMIFSGLLDACTHEVNTN